MTEKRIRFSVSLFTVFMLLFVVAVAVVTWSVSYEFDHYSTQEQSHLNQAYYRSIEQHVESQFERIDLELNQAKQLVALGVLRVTSPTWRRYLSGMLQHSAFEHQKIAWFPSGASPILLGKNADVDASMVKRQLSSFAKHSRDQSSWALIKLGNPSQMTVSASIRLHNTQHQRVGTLMMLLDSIDMRSALNQHLGRHVVAAELLGPNGQVIAQSTLLSNGHAVSDTWKQHFQHVFSDAWSLKLSLSDQHVGASLWRIHQRTLGIALIVMMIGAFLIYTLSRAFSKTLDGLIVEAKKISRFDLSQGDALDSRIVEFHTVIDAVKQMKTGLRGFVKYVPVELVRRLLQSKTEARIGGRKAPITILFSDIMGCTNLMESESLQVMTDHLCQYFDICSQKIKEHHGTIDKYIGDSVMAFWGAPHDDANQVEHACQAAVAMQLALQQAFTEWEANGLPRLNTRIGLDCGDVVVGNIGSSSRINYTVLGDAVNAASRLEALAGVYGVTTLMSDRVHRVVAEKFSCRLLDTISVKGQAAVMSVYELQVETSRHGVNFSDYEEGLAAYREGNWPLALKSFQKQQHQTPQDGPTALMVARCQGTCPADWDGVWHYDHK